MIRNIPRRPIWLTFAILLAAILVTSSWLTLSDRPAGASGDTSTIDGQLAELLEELPAGQKIDVVIYLVGQERLFPQEYAGDSQSQRTALVSSLVERNNQALSSVEALILQEVDGGRASDFRKLWIINGAQLSASRETINKLAANPGVREIKFDQKIQWLNPQELASQQTAMTLPWGIERIRASYAWDGLGIDGSGVTIAVMDTGVDWNHPDLASNYKGFNAANDPDHSYSWFDAIDATPSPFDPNGHGTHVAGTAVGKNGIGVSPGAKWIGVRVLDALGMGQIGDIHAGFQWMLAPNGDPAQSPDIVNGSWSGSSMLLDFIPDIDYLKDAGIIPVFAAGNNGPAIGSVGAPAAYEGTIAVGAADDQEIVAWFSSRGPSQLAGETKPTFTAPGTHVLSADPGGDYQIRSGTSMAAPHVTGLYALMLSAQPGLGEAALTAIITETTWRNDNDWPNNNSGWGRVDAYSAVSQLAVGGLISGSVRQGSEFIAGANITIGSSGGLSLPFHSDANGLFHIKLTPGSYSMSIEKFGFSSYYTPSFLLEADFTKSFQIDLAKLPAVKVSGRLSDQGTNSAISGTIKVLNSPLKQDIGVNGLYEVELPIGQYQLLVSATGYESQRKTIDLSTSDLILDYKLIPAPRTLLVDSGNWYYSQQLEYISTALEATDIGFDIWRIRNPYGDIPDINDLSGYDVVVWSSPLDSPGYINAAEAVSAYLDGGGMLLITGQDVGQYAGTAVFYEDWWFRQLKAKYNGSVAPTQAILGASGTTYEGLEFHLNGSDSANNQVSPDSGRPSPGSLTEVAFRYQDGSPAGLQAGLCEPFKIVYLGFGMEGVSGLENRRAILESSYNYFNSPTADAGLQLNPISYDQLVPRGYQTEFEIEITNTGESMTDTFDLELANLNWPATIVTSTLTLGPCSAGKTRILVNVPADAGVDAEEEFELHVSSTNSDTLQAILPIRLKTPGKILLVDDDRFYDQAPLYRQALESLGLPHDFWDTDPWPQGNGSPGLSLLEQYDYVIWYTAYDWFQPVTANESEALTDYLEGGGRLFLTSQDFLYYHFGDPLSTTYLGILDYLESVEPRFIIGNLGMGIPVGPYELDYGLYQNFSDGIVPTPAGRTIAWNDNGTTAGIGVSGDSWRTVFWSLPVEKIPSAVRPEIIRQSLGWLSALGDSTFENQHVAVGGFGSLDSINIYTATIRNNSFALLNPLAITNTLPESLNIVPGTLTEGVIYDNDNREITWEGSLEAGEQLTFSYATRTNVPVELGTLITNSLHIFDPELDLTFDRSNHTWVGEADISASSIEISPTVVRTGESGAIGVTLVNDGFRTAVISATVYLAPGVSPLTPTLAIDAGKVFSGEQHFGWSLILNPGGSAHASITFATTKQVENRWLPVTLVIQTNSTDPVVRTALLEMIPYRVRLPLITLNRED